MESTKRRTSVWAGFALLHWCRYKLVSKLLGDSLRNMVMKVMLMDITLLEHSSISEMLGFQMWPVLLRQLSRTAVHKTSISEIKPSSLCFICIFFCFHIWWAFGKPSELFNLISVITVTFFSALQLMDMSWRLFPLSKGAENDLYHHVFAIWSSASVTWEACDGRESFLEFTKR